MIILYNPWSTPSRKKPMPISLLAVASVLDAECEIVDANLEPAALQHIVEIGNRRGITAIGVTVMPGPQLNHALADSRRLKQALPQVPIVWGGYFPSQHADVILRESCVDYCVRSQGEQTFAELVRVLELGGELSAICGLSYRDGDSIRHAARRPLVSPDELPDWPYHKLQMEHYFHSHYLGSRVAAHHSSYGCPFACNFCAVVEMVQQRWLPQSPERVERVLRYLRDRFGADAVQFWDMDFFVSERRTAEIADRIGNLGMNWWALGRVDELMRYSESTWQKMKTGGLKMFFSGAESGSDALLKRMNKGGKATAALTLELAKRARSYGIIPEFSFVLGNPPDPREDILVTIEFIRRLKTVNPDTEIILYMYTPVPLEGTLYESARSLGFRFPDTLDEWVGNDWRNYALRRDPGTPWRDGKLQRKVRNFERILNARYPTATDRNLAGVRRSILQLLGGWRYRLRIYSYPIELRAFQRWVGYQRPETTGF